MSFTSSIILKSSFVKPDSLSNTSKTISDLLIISLLFFVPISSIKSLVSLIPAVSIIVIGIPEILITASK